MKILAFESSCDETAAAVMEDGRTILSSVIASSADMHAIYGGVVPEIASRKHVEAISGLADEALRQAGVDKSDIDAVAVTHAPASSGPCWWECLLPSRWPTAWGYPSSLCTTSGATSPPTTSPTPIWSRPFCACAFLAAPPPWWM